MLYFQVNRQKYNFLIVFLRIFITVLLFYADVIYMSVFLDQYSYLHFSTGIIAYFWGINVCLWTLLHLLYEILENLPMSIYIINHYITMWPGGKPYPDPFLNSIGDVFSGTIGWLSAYYLDVIGSHYKWYKIHIPS